jgi:hypothetical protein
MQRRAIAGRSIIILALILALTFVSMLLSSFMLWYTELPDVRLGLVRE